MKQILTELIEEIDNSTITVDIQYLTFNKGWNN